MRGGKGHLKNEFIIAAVHKTSIVIFYYIVFSNGSGRSGTFIAVQVLIQDKEENNSIPALVKELKRCRPYMVESFVS